MNKKLASDLTIAIALAVGLSAVACGPQGSNPEVEARESELAEVSSALAPAVIDRRFREQLLDIAAGRPTIELREVQHVQLSNGMTLNDLFAEANIASFPQMQMHIPDVPNLLDDDPLVGWRPLNDAPELEVYDGRGNLRFVAEGEKLARPLFEVDDISIRHKHRRSKGRIAR